MAILSMAGVLPSSAKSGYKLKAAPRQTVRYEETAFWSTITGLIDAAVLRPAENFRAAHAADIDGLMCLTLALLPEPVIKALAGQTGFSFCTRPNLRVSAASWPSWVPGPHMKRFGGVPSKVWVFQTTEADSLLMKLIRRVQEASNTKKKAEIEITILSADMSACKKRL